MSQPPRSGAVPAVELHLRGRRREVADVPDVLAVDHEHDQLRQIGAVIRYAFQPLGHRLHVDPALDGLGVAHHRGQDLAEDLVIELVHRVVASDDVTRLVLVAMDERIDRVAHHALDEVRGAHDFIVVAQQGLGGQVDGPLADVDGQISDALQVRDHLEGQRDEAQVGAHGLTLCEDHQAQLVDVDFGLIDLVVSLDGAPREFHVPLDQSPNRIGDHRPRCGRP